MIRFIRRLFGLSDPTNLRAKHALLLAAAQITHYPRTYYFMAIGIPNIRKPLETQVGCALGWIAAFGGVSPAQRGFNAGAQDVLGLGGPDYDATNIFYQRMDDLIGSDDWIDDNAAATARGLRAYAAKYHP